MKKYGILLWAGLAGTLHASPWGIDTPVRQPSFLERIAAREPVSVCVDGNLEAYSFAPEQLGEAVSRWLRSVYSRIEEAGRKTEFKDLEDVLTRPVRITRQPCSDNAALKREFASMLAKGSSARGYAYAPVREDLRVILLPPEYVASSAGVKVVGYLLRGAEDRPAVLALNGAAPDVKLLWQEMGVSLSMPRREGLAAQREYVVNGGVNFTCSDLDDFILGLDCVAGLHPRRGGAAGWKSFCPGSLKTYVRCRAQGGWTREGEKGLPSRAAYDAWRQLAARKLELSPAALTKGYDPTDREVYDVTRKDEQGRLTYARRGDEEYYWTYYPRYTRVRSMLGGEFLHDTDIVQTPRYLSIERKAGGVYRKTWEIDFLEKGALAAESEELADEKEKVFGCKISFATWEDSREETYDEPDLNLNTTVLRPKAGSEGEWIIVKTDRGTRYAGLRVQVDANGARGLEEYVPLAPKTFLSGERMLPFTTRFGTDGPEPDFKREFSAASLRRDVGESRVYEERFRRLMHNFYPGLDLSGEPIKSTRREAGKRRYERKPGRSPRVHKFVPKK